MIVEFTEYEYYVLNILVANTIEGLSRDLQRQASLSKIESKYATGVKFDLSVYKRLLSTIKNHNKKVVSEHDSSDEYLDWLEKMYKRTTDVYLESLKESTTMGMSNHPQCDSAIIKGQMLSLKDAIANYKKKLNKNKG